MLLSGTDHATYFEAKYRATTDPWSTGTTEGLSIYERMIELLKRQRSHYRHTLDVGCGEGSFTQRLAEISNQATGIDISSTAIKRAIKQAQNVGNIDFYVLDLVAEDVAKVAPEGRFDLIDCSQVLSYYSVDQLAATLTRLASALSDDGYLLVTNTSEGNRYQLSDMLQLLTNDFSIVQSQQLDNHYMVLAVRKRPFLCITIDYEGWDDLGGTGRTGIPNVDLLISNTNELLKLTEQSGGRLTLFAEVAQIDFWQQHAPHVAEAMISQLQQAHQRGHGVELHLHPRWVRALGATFDREAGQACLAMDKAHLAALSDDELRDTITWADGYLRDIIRQVDPTYRATAFRAGAYQIQPHCEVFRVLKDLGYDIDSSAWKGGFTEEKEGIRGFDFRQLWTSHEPYYPASDDINLPTDQSETDTLLEMPIAAESGRTLNIDSLSADQFCEQADSHNGQHLIAIGHSKCMTAEKLSNYEQIMQRLHEQYAFSAIHNAGLDFANSSEGDNTDRQRAIALAYYERILPRLSTIESSLTPYNQGKIDSARQLIDQLKEHNRTVRVVDFGCGTGELFTLPIASRLKDDERVEFTGFDVDPASIVRLEAHIRRNEISNLSATYEDSQLPNEGYDLVCCLEVLEHLEDPQPIVDRLAELVAPGGLLYLTIPNGFGPAEIESNTRKSLKRFIVKSDFLLKMAVRIKRLLIGSPVPQSEETTREIAPTETMHVANNVHVQQYSRRRIKSMFENSTLNLVEQGNSAFLTGLSARVLRFIPGMVNLNLRLTNKVPGIIASGWYFVFTKPPRQQ